MENKIAVNKLNNLIEINNDRVIGYETAKLETENNDFNFIFENHILTSKKYIAELKTEVVSIGGEIENSTKATGRLHRLWMDFKAAISSNNRASILSSCAFGDNEALNIYNEEIIENFNYLSKQIQNAITEQFNQIKKEYSQIIELEKAIV